MCIALMGTRAIPANHGGMETLYENLTFRLVARAQAAMVYHGPHAIGRSDAHDYRDVRLVNLPSISTKHLDAITHICASVIHRLGRVRPYLASDFRNRDDDDLRQLTFTLVGEQCAARPPSEPIQTDPARMSSRPRR